MWDYFCLVLKDLGPNRLLVLAYLHELHNIPLAEIKASFVDLPKIVAKGDVPYMMRLEKELKALGAEVQIRPAEPDRTWKRELIATIELDLIGGHATPLPPVGPALGPHGVNIGQFVVNFNQQTQQWEGAIVRVIVSVFNDRSHTFTLQTPTED